MNNTSDTDRLNWYESMSRDFRFIHDVSMCGTYPCVSVYLSQKGRCQFKTLREAIDAHMEDTAEITKRIGFVKAEFGGLHPYQEAIIRRLLSKQPQ